MPSQKRVKRIQATNAAFEAAVEASNAQEVLTSVDDTALFTLDRAGSKAGRKKVEKELKPKESPAFVTAAEKAVIAKLQSKKRKAYGGDVVEVNQKKRITTAHGKIDMSLTDLWGDAVVEVPKPVPVVDELSTTIVHAKSAPKQAREEKKNTKVKVAVPGQSYHPTPKDHQNALAEALAIEIKRQEAIEANKKDGLAFADPKNRREITQLLLGEGDDDDEDSDDDSKDGNLLVEGDEEDGEDDVKRKIRKMKQKLTKAERNKKRARKHAMHEESKIKQEAELLKAIDKIEHIVKETKKEVALKEQQRKAREAAKQEELRAKSMMVGISPHEVSSVPLSDELNGSLRTVIPKGVSIVDRTQSLLEKGELSSRSRKTRKIENPHGARKVKWVPKYKYTTPGKEYIESLQNK